MSYLYSYIVFCFVLELELQQQRLDEGSKVESFCGPGSETHSILDCISVPNQKIQELQNNGRRFLQNPILKLTFPGVIYLMLDFSREIQGTNSIQLNDLPTPQF